MAIDEGTDEGIDEGLDVVLRTPVEGDAARWLEMLADPDYQRYGAPSFVPPTHDVGEALEKFAAAADAWAERRPGTLVIADAADPDRLLGDISWRWTGTERLEIADLGYVVHPDSRGRRVGRTAIVLLSRWLLASDGRGLARVQLDHSVENPASCRVALAAGFEQEGIRRGFLPLRDPDGGVRRHDVCLHGTTTPPPLPERSSAGT